MAPIMRANPVAVGARNALRALAAATALLGQPLAGQEGTPIFEPLYLGYGSEPDMDSGGRVIGSLGRLLDRSLNATSPAANKPGLMAAWEIPIGLVFSAMVNHELAGHGGRGREFQLEPRYGLGFGLSAWTEIRREPESILQVLLLAQGGTEANQVQAQRLQRNFFRPGGAEGATLPMLFFAKLDLSTYVSTTPSPGSAKFREAFDHGHDIAIWLVSRQAQRSNIHVRTLWNREFALDTADPLLDSNFRSARKAALWNLLDPALAASIWGYASDHLGRGRMRISPPMLPLGEGFGLMLATRGTLGPSEVSRYLDVYLRTPAGLFTGYSRILDSDLDRTHGGGLGIHELALGKSMKGSLQGDWWKEPAAREALGFPSRGWNASAGLDVHLGPSPGCRSSWGLSLSAGRKSRGFFPGRPLEAGSYFSIGLLVALGRTSRP